MLCSVPSSLSSHALCTGAVFCAALQKEEVPQLLNEKTADGPCVNVCSGDRSHKDLRRTREGTIQKSWGKGLRGMGFHDVHCLWKVRGKSEAKPAGPTARGP